LIVGGICLIDETDATEFRPTLRLLLQARSAPLASLTLQILVAVDAALVCLRKVPWKTLCETLEEWFGQLESVRVGVSVIELVDSETWSVVMEDEPDDERERLLEAAVRGGCSAWVRQKLVVHFDMEI
jgi:hypothetical protein